MPELGALIRLDLAFRVCFDMGVTLLSTLLPRLYCASAAPFSGTKSLDHACLFRQRLVDYRIKSLAVL